MIFEKRAADKNNGNNSNFFFVLICGWAADYRIFGRLSSKINYLLSGNFSALTFEKSLLKAIKDNKISKISLTGFSLGGFAAAEFASKHPDLIEELVLISVRKKYKKEELAKLKELLKRNKKAYLYKFYAQCFLKKEQANAFKQDLFKDYCEKFDLKYLLETLDYLGQAEIKPELLNKVKKIKIIHGERDAIAPIQEAAAIVKSLPRAEFIPLKNTGHIPFKSKLEKLWLTKKR